MTPLYTDFDVLVTMGLYGPALKIHSHRSIHFWQKQSVATPFNVTGGPALVQCMGYSESGLPLSPQIAGRPFDESTVLRVADAYERATSWGKRQPELPPGSTVSGEDRAIPEPDKADISEAHRDRIAVPARRAGLEPTAVVTDAGYGDQTSFLDGLEARQMAYVAALSGTVRFRLADTVEADLGDPPSPR